MSSPTLSVVDVADHLGISVKWVYVHKQTLPGYFKIGGAIFFDRETFLAGIKNIANKPTPPAGGSGGSSPLDRHNLTT